MSNYPPGVTGNEYPIAGPDHEWDESRECDAEGFSVIVTSDYLRQQLEAASDSLRSAENATDEGLRTRSLLVAQARIRAALSDVVTIDIDNPCPFSGDVTLQAYAGMITWECPLCGTHHEEER